MTINQMVTEEDPSGSWEGSVAAPAREKWITGGLSFKKMEVEWTPDPDFGVQLVLSGVQGEVTSLYTPTKI